MTNPIDQKSDNISTAASANLDKEAVGQAFLTVLADPNVKWRDTGASEFIQRVAEEAGFILNQKDAAKINTARAITPGRTRH